jgi:formylglycine-generating enzyme required for sulfatase activity
MLTSSSVLVTIGFFLLILRLTIDIKMKIQSDKRMIKNSLLFMLIFITQSILANNLEVSNVSLTGQDTTNNFVLVQFDVSWENSWRVTTGPSNWDAAWIFVKYRLKNDSLWNHASLNWIDGTGSGDGHTEPTNANIASANDNGSGNSYGVFVHRDAAMAQGSVNYTGVQLRWNYGDDGLADDDSIEIRIFGIEMVYVPQSAFDAGDGASSAIKGQFENGTSGNPLQITSEGALTLGGGAAGSLGNNNASGMNSGGLDDFNDITSQTLPAAFPKGFDAFYCMKYEISQAQYSTFLNQLTATQDGNRFPNNNGSARHAITGSSGSRTTTNPFVACNHLSWVDVASYLDWAALRPMTELEYEKACRGTISAVTDEFAWGNTSITGATGISNPGAANETASNTGANSVNGNNVSVQGPMRVGCLGQGINTRVGVGATYYGILEMSGNVEEVCISVGDSTGRAFTGVHGDGVLNSNGNYDVANWPRPNARGTGYRGGSWRSSPNRHRISDRTLATRSRTGRNQNRGGRGVRLAP